MKVFSFIALLLLISSTSAGNYCINTVSDAEVDYPGCLSCTGDDNIDCETCLDGYVPDDADSECVMNDAQLDLSTADDCAVWGGEDGDGAVCVQCKKGYVLHAADGYPWTTSVAADLAGHNDDDNGAIACTEVNANGGDAPAALADDDCDIALCDTCYALDDGATDQPVICVECRSLFQWNSLAGSCGFPAAISADDWSTANDLQMGATACGDDADDDCEVCDPDETDVCLICKNDDDEYGVAGAVSGSANECLFGDAAVEGAQSCEGDASDDEDVVKCMPWDDEVPFICKDLFSLSRAAATGLYSCADSSDDEDGDDDNCNDDEGYTEINAPDGEAVIVCRECNSGYLVGPDGKCAEEPADDEEDDDESAVLKATFSAGVLIFAVVGGLFA